MTHLQPSAVFGKKRRVRCKRCKQRPHGNDRLRERGKEIARELRKGGLYGPRLAALISHLPATTDAEMPSEASEDLNRLIGARAVKVVNGRPADVEMCARCMQEVLEELLPYECPICHRLADPVKSAIQYETNLNLAMHDHPLTTRILERLPLVQHTVGLAAKRELNGRAPSVAELERVTRADPQRIEDTLYAITQRKLAIGRGTSAFRVRPLPCSRCLTPAEEDEAEASARFPVSAQLRFRVLQRDGFRCRYCGRGPSEGGVLHVDHVVPYAAGGTTTEGNLITACAECNLGKGTSDVIGTKR